MQPLVANDITPGYALRMAGKKGPKTESVHIRVSPDLAKRLDKRVETMRRKLPTGGWSRANVVRLALERYLAPKPRT